MRFSSPLGPTVMAAEALITAVIAIAILAVAVVAAFWFLLWLLERISYWGAHNKRSKQELIELMRQRQTAISNIPPVTGGKRRTDKTTRRKQLKASGEIRVQLARQLFPHACNWLGFTSGPMLVEHSIAEWIAWLRRAEANNASFLCAMIHYQLGFKVAIEGEYKNALYHFEQAREAFESVSHGLTEGQAMVQCLEALQTLGHSEAGSILQTSREMILNNRFSQQPVVEGLTRNLGAARIRLKSPRGVELFLQASEAYQLGRRSEAADLFGQSAQVFEHDLAGCWYRWPVAVAYHEQILADIFAAGYDVFDHWQLIQCFQLIDVCEVPCQWLREQMQENLELAGVKVV